MEENCVKKLLSLLISVTIVFLSVANGVVAYAAEAQYYGLENFADNLIDMIREHDEVDMETTNGATADRFYSSASSTNKYDNLGPTAFATRRLVVKSDKKIDYQGAIDCISGYRDLYILQYETIVDAQDAYDYYLTLDYIDYVEPDYVMKMQGLFSNDDESLSDKVDDVIDDVIDDEALSDKVDDVIDDVKDYIDDKDEDEDKTYTFHETAISYVSELIGYEDIKEELAEKVNDDFIQVAVLDSGIDTDHELFVDRLIESNVNFSNSGEENSCEDDYGHGTHVAGIIADNTLSNVKIKPYKVLNSAGYGSESLIAIAIDLAVAEGADLINMSISSDGEFQTLTDSVNNAFAQGVNVVVAAGNNKKDLNSYYVSPACVENAFTVSATTEDDKLAEYSNYNNTIDICAPGNDIKSSYNNGGYVKLSGTSMAAPQVTAALAIVYTVFPDKTAKEAEEYLQEYAVDLYEEKGENKFGEGRLYLKYILGDKPRTADPEFSVASGTFSNSFDLKITCPENNATIYYVISDEEDFIEIDWYNNAKRYTNSIRISLDTTIYAIAQVEGKYVSSIVKAEYVRATGSEADYYDINSSGLITAYLGTETDLIIPSRINNKTVKGIAPGAFEDNEEIRSVVLPSTATKIMSKAFRGCTNLDSVTGSGITRVEFEAFKNSGISTFSFDKVTYISSGAFENCENLKNVNLSNVETIQSSAFKNAKGIDKLDSEKLTALGTYAFQGSDIKEVNVPNLTSISANAFENCQSLTTVYIPYAKTISISAFQNCTALNSINVDVLETIGASAFRNTGFEYMICPKLKTLGNYAFSECQNLALISLPKATTIGSYAFQDCPELQIVDLPTLEILKNNSFSNCPKLLHLYLPAVETVQSGALDGSSIEYLNFENVKEIKNLPSTLQGILLPSSLTEISATVPETDFIVYGYEDTCAQEFAIENNKQFETVPAVVYEVDNFIDPEDAYILVYALGFNCTYQWYKNSEVSNENGTLIEGATRYYYKPSLKDNAVSYYCVITSNDGTKVNTITTKPIENAPEFRYADYTEYNQICEEFANIDRTLYKDGECEKVDTLIAINVSGLTMAQQDLLNSHITDIKNAIASLKYKFTLYDVNDDGKISILDARLALKAVVGSLQLDTLQFMSADANEDGKISIGDSRLILKSVINK